MLAYLFITSWIIKLGVGSSLGTAGVNFVFSIPKTWDPSAVQVSMYMTTEVEVVEVHVMEPKQKIDILKVNWKTKKYLIRRNEAFEHKFNDQADLVMSTNGVYWATRIKAFGQIRIFAMIDHNNGGDADGLRLVPEASSHRRYYVTTANRNPFLLVTAFSQPAIVKVDFPNYDGAVKLDHACGEDNKAIVTNKCMSNTANTIHLGAYNVWYFSIHYERNILSPPKFSFQNTLIISDAPISVVAGNSICKVGDTSQSRDICLCNMKAVDSWGKEYFVPNVNSFFKDPMDIYFRINAIKFPFSLELHFPPNNKEQKIVSDFTSVVHLGQKPDSFVATAKDPFALYMMTPSRVAGGLPWDASLLNVLPTAAWMSGIIYVDTPQLQHAFIDTSFFLVVNTKPDAMLFPDATPDQIDWKPLVKVNGNDYHYGYVKLNGLTTRIMNNKNLGKLQLYVAGNPGISAAFLFAYDFYTGAINYYNKTCVESVRVLPSDGIDNDCDSMIDEERLNNVDDDGDGKIDEDYVEIYQDGGWSEWLDACTINCKTKTYVRQIRACAEPFPSRFGNPCDGKGEICTGTGNGSCPKDCAGQPLEQSCECREGCSQCMKNESECSACKPGYYATKYCMVPCAKGFGGVGCSTVIVLNSTDTNDNDNNNEGFPWWLIVIGVLAATTLACCLAFLWRRKKRKEEEMKIPEEEVAADDFPKEDEEGSRKSKEPIDEPMSRDSEGHGSKATGSAAGDNVTPGGSVVGGNVTPGGSVVGGSVAGGNVTTGGSVVGGSVAPDTT